VATAIVITLLGQQTTYHFTQLQANIPAGTPAPNPADPTYAQAAEQMVAQAGTSAINDVFIYLAFGTVLVLLLAFALPSRKSVVEQERQAAEAEGGVLEAVPMHMG
jgi:hypothetical protein